MARVEELIVELQQEIRREGVPDAEWELGWRHAAIPEDLQTDDAKWMRISGPEFRAFEAVTRALGEDPRFEYLDETHAEAALWRFAAQATVQPDSDAVGDFVAAHARQPTTTVCFFGVELLAVPNEIELPGARLLPIDSITIPSAGPWPDSRDRVRSVIAVDVTGTNTKAMRDRGLTIANHALRHLRVPLADHLDRIQPRFRIAELWWLDGNQFASWNRAPNSAVDLDLIDEFREAATAREVAALTHASAIEIDVQAKLAVEWCELACLAVDPNVEALFFFFAVEALVGQRKRHPDGKARMLAVRRAMLGFLAEEQWARHPARIYGSYNDVRSASVHGDARPRFEPGELRSFGHDVRLAVDQFLRFAHERGFTTREEVIDALDTHESRGAFVERLKAEDPDTWGNVKS